MDPVTPSIQELQSRFELVPDAFHADANLVRLIAEAQANRFLTQSVPRLWRNSIPKARAGQSISIRRRMSRTYSI